MWSECGWLDAGDSVSNVVLTLVLHRRMYTTSATDQASNAFDSTASASGDAARPANVTIEEYWGPRPADEVAADTEALARAAVNRVRLTQLTPRVPVSGR